MIEVEFDPNIAIYILIIIYMNLLGRSRNQARPILMDLLTTQRPTMNTVPSTNSIVRSILSYDDAVTKMHLRISSKTFVEISKFLPNKNVGWGPEIELLIFLLWLASGTSYRMVGAATDVPKSTVCDIVHKLLDFTAINIMPKVVALPSEDKLPSIGHKFNRRARTTIFEKAAGAIDGTHVEIVCPVHLHDQYINRKLKYSIQCQAICDSNFKFVAVFIGYPGSVHDSRVLYCSPVFKEKLYPPPGYFLLGDSGYPCRMQPIGIVTPFEERNLNNDQKMFNKVFSAARNIVECAFGKMKIRLGSIIGRALQLKIENIVKTVAACFTFHNICIMTNDNLPLLLDADVEAFSEPSEEEIVYTLDRDQQSGIDLRDQLFQMFLHSR